MIKIVFVNKCLKRTKSYVRQQTVGRKQKKKYSTRHWAETTHTITLTRRYCFNKSHTSKTTRSRRMHKICVEKNKKKNSSKFHHKETIPSFVSSEISWKESINLLHLFCALFAFSCNFRKKQKKGENFCSVWGLHPRKFYKFLFYFSVCYLFCEMNIRVWR